MSNRKSKLSITKIPGALTSNTHRRIEFWYHACSTFTTFLLGNVIFLNPFFIHVAITDDTTSLVSTCPHHGHMFHNLHPAQQVLAKAILAEYSQNLWLKLLIYNPFMQNTTRFHILCRWEIKSLLYVKTWND